MGTSFDMMGILPFAAMIVVVYFIMLRPQQQKVKMHQNMIANLRRGDRVVTSGGLIGTVSKIVSDKEVQLEIADDIRVRHVKGHITEVLAKTDPINLNESIDSISSKDNFNNAIVKRTSTTKSKMTRKAPANRATGK
ncbi:MAG: preprotein translocase subunit YajC [Alphaproteobacteria bacterium]|nr:preprotein translocase subunit YajC [Alphaproteobacteria bacterium]